MKNCFKLVLVTAVLSLAACVSTPAPAPTDFTSPGCPPKCPKPI